MSDTVLVVIPARYSSTRFPGKPLADLNGKPMIRRVWERAVSAKRPDRVLVATDDDRIAKAVRDFGGEVAMTAATHRTGTERVAEVAARFSHPVVVNLQGDLPIFPPATLDRLIEASAEWIQRGEVDLATAKAEIVSEEEIFSPHSVKVVTDRQNRALYFSRSPIPYIERPGAERPIERPGAERPIERGTFGKSATAPFYKHFGFYLYRRDFLLQIARAPEGNLERMERLEQLRVLEEGGRVRVVEIGKDEARQIWEVNTPEDLAGARALLSMSPLDSN